MLLVVVNSCRAGTEWSNWESMDCCNVCHGAREDWEERERTRVGNKQLTHMIVHNNSKHGFFPGSVCLPLCLFAGSLVVDQGRPVAIG